MNITTTPTCESLFLHVYVNDNELERIAKRLRLTPMREPMIFDMEFCERICCKLHNNVTIYVYGDKHILYEKMENTTHG